MMVWSVARVEVGGDGEECVCRGGSEERVWVCEGGDGEEGGGGVMVKCVCGEGLVRRGGWEAVLFRNFVFSTEW